MVYVYTKKSALDKYVGQVLTTDEIKDTLVDLGMDVKGEEKLDNDVELKVEITAEKTDLVSAVGIARAIKYYRGIESGAPRYSLKKGENRVIVKKEASRPKTSCVVLRNFNLTDELLDELIEIQEKIHDSFGRNRKKVSIGIYPLDEFKFPVTFTAENPKDIVFRPLESETEMNGYEILSNHETGKKFAHLLNDCDLFPVFRDSENKVLSMPPIINSHETGRVNTKHKDLFIECSGFNLEYLDNIMKVLVTTFIEFGAEAESVKVEYEDSSEVYELNLDNYEDELDLNYVRKLIGVDINSSNIESYLNKMMFGLKKIQGDKLTVEVPSFRSDIWHDSDIADDIARAYGYNNISPKFPEISSVGETLEHSQFKERISNTLVSMGYLELYTYILSSSRTQYGKMLLDESKVKYIRLIDSEDQGINMCRTLILPEILTSLHINRKNSYPQKVFENGFTLQVDKSKETGARNESHVACAIAGPKSNYTEIVTTLNSLTELNGIDIELVESDEPFLIQGRGADIIIGSKKVGFIGELHPQVIENFGLLVPISVFEFNLDL